MKTVAKTAKTKPPITAHPWFPAIVGLWFAALFGLSSLAVAPASLERIVTALRIDQVFAAAQPPLGETARLLVALAMSSIGEVLGLLFGRYLGRSRQPAEAVRTRRVGPARGAEPTVAVEPSAAPRKPLSASEDLRGIDTMLRQRALASESELEAQPFRDVAPLPGAASNHDAQPAEPAATAQSEDPVAMPDHAFAAPQHAPFAAPTVAHEAIEAVPEPEHALDLGGFAALETPVASAAPFAAPIEPQVAVAPAAVPTAAASFPAPVVVRDVATASLDSLGVVQLSERLALAMQARRERLSARALVAAVAPPVAVEPVPFAPPVQSHEPLPADAEAGTVEDQPAEAAVEVAEPVAEPEVETEQVETPGAEPAEPVAPAAEEIATAWPAAAEPPALPRLPDRLTGFAVAADSEDEDEEFDSIPALARSLSAPAGQFSQPHAFAAPEPAPEAAPSEPQDNCFTGSEAPETPELARGLEILARRAGKAIELPPCAEPEAADTQTAQQPEETGAEDAYSSLLNMRNASHRAAPARIEIDEPQTGEIEPVVVFPGHGPRIETAPPPFAPFAAPQPAANLAPFAVPPSPAQAAAAPFAAPTAAVPHQPSGFAPATPAAAASAVDPAEAERALKAALASLQRISGAR